MSSFPIRNVVLVDSNAFLQGNSLPCTVQLFTLVLNQKEKENAEVKGANTWFQPTTTVSITFVKVIVAMAADSEIIPFPILFHI